MLELNEDLFIGAGKRRRCCRHPDDPEKRIKIGVSGGKKGRDMQTGRERKYYRLYTKRGCSLKHLSPCYGMEDSNMGPGAVFGIIHNPDGEISATLGSFILGGMLIKDFEEELRELREYMFKEGIICSDFNHGNILVQNQSDGSRRLMIIDGLGNSDLIKVADYYKPFRDKKLERKWARLLWRLGTFEEKARNKT